LIAAPGYKRATVRYSDIMKNIHTLTVNPWFMTDSSAPINVKKGRTDGSKLSPI
jgi:hypothetical protein